MADSIGAVIIDVKSDISYLVAGMQRAENVVSKSANLMMNSAAMVAVGWGAVSLKSFIDETVESVTEQKAFAEQLSISIETLTKYEYIASKAHVSTDQMRDAFKDAGTKVTEFQREGESAKEAFEALGISQDFAKKNMTTTEKSMDILLQRLAKFPDGMQKATIAQEIFGDEGASVIRVANLGADAIKRYTEEAIKGNIATSEAFSNKSAVYADAQNRLEALQGGWASAVIEESHFLEMGTSMYKLLGDSVIAWTEDVQHGNSEFIDGLNTVNNGIHAVFPTAIEITGTLGHSFLIVGESVLYLSGLVLDSIGNLIGWDTEANKNITTLGHLASYSVGASMAIENFANLIMLGSIELEVFSIAIETKVNSALNAMTGSILSVTADVSKFINTVSFGELAEDYERLALKAESYTIASQKSTLQGVIEIDVLRKKQMELIKNIHTTDEMKLAVETTAIDVSLRQKEGIDLLDKLKNKNNDYNKSGKESIKILNDSMKALEDAENKKKSLTNATSAHEKALKSEARAYEKLKKERERAEQQRLEALANFNDVYNQSTMSRFDYALLKLNEEKKKYQELHAEKYKIDAWYDAEYKKLLESKTAKAKEEQEKRVKAIKDEYNLGMQLLKISQLNFELVGGESNKLSILQHELELLEKQQSVKYTIAHQNELEIEILNKKLDIKKEIEAETEKSWKKTEDRQRELFEAYQESIQNQIKAQNDLNSARERGLKTIFDGILAGDRLGDTLHNAIDGFNKDIANSFSDSISTAIMEAYKNGTSVDFGIFDEKGGLTSVGMNGAMALGGAIIGSLMEGSKSYYTTLSDGDVSSVERTSGGLFSGSSTKILEKETQQLQMAFDSTIRSYDILLSSLFDFTDDLEILSGRYSSGELLGEVVPQAVIDEWMGLSIDNQDVSRLENLIAERDDNYSRITALYSRGFTVTTDMIDAYEADYDAYTKEIENLASQLGVSVKGSDVIVSAGIEASREIKDAWQTYADLAFNGDFNQALIDSMTQFEQAQTSLFETLNSDNEIKILEAKNEKTSENVKRMFNELNELYDNSLHEINSSNFNQISQNYAEDVFTPKQANLWTAFGEALSEDEKISKSLTDALRDEALARQDLRDSSLSSSRDFQHWIDTFEKSDLEVALADKTRASSEYNEALMELYKSNNGLDKRLLADVPKFFDEVNASITSTSDILNLFSSASTEKELEIAQRVADAYINRVETESAYADEIEEANKKINDLLKTLTDTTSSFTEFKATYNMSDLEKANYEINKTSHELGLVGVTFENFGSMLSGVEDKVKSGIIDEDDLQKYDELASALENKYSLEQDLIKETEGTFISVIKSLISHNDKIVEYDDIVAQNRLDNAQIELDNAQAIEDALEQAKDEAISLAKEIESSYINVYNSIKDYSDKIQDLNEIDAQYELDYQDAIAQQNQELYDVQLQYIEDVKDATENMFDSATTSFEDLIRKIKGDSGTETENKFDLLVSYNAKQSELEKLLSLDSVDSDEFRSTYEDFLKIADTLSSASYFDSTDLNNNIVDRLQYDLNIFGTTDTIAKVEIVSDSSAEAIVREQLSSSQLDELKNNNSYLDYLNSIVATDNSVGKFDEAMALAFAKNNNLNFDQFTQLQQVASDGYVTNRELSNLTGFSEEQVNSLSSLTGVVAKDVTIDNNAVVQEVKLEDLKTLSADQLRELQDSTLASRYLNSIIATDESVAEFDEMMAIKFADANKLNYDQYIELQGLAEDGVLTNSELNNIKTLSASQIKSLTELQGVTAKDITLGYLNSSIASDFASANNLTVEQTKELQVVAKDGKLTNTELANIKGLSDAQRSSLLSIANLSTTNSGNTELINKGIYTLTRDVAKDSTLENLNGDDYWSSKEFYDYQNYTSLNASVGLLDTIKTYSSRTSSYTNSINSNIGNLYWIQKYPIQNLLTSIRDYLREIRDYNKAIDSDTSSIRYYTRKSFWELEDIQDNTKNTAINTN